MAALQTKLPSTEMLERSIRGPKRPRGNLKYSISPELALLLKDMIVFAKLEMEVLHAFTSRYALALHEAVACRVGLKHIFTERFNMGDFRKLLGVEADKLTAFGNQNQYAIKPALMEVNALPDFTVTVVPEKTGRRVTNALIGWREGHQRPESRLCRVAASPRRPQGADHWDR